MQVGNDRPPPHATADVVVLHPTRIGLLQTWAGGLGLLVMAALAAAFGSSTLAPLLFTAVGAAAVLWVAWDVPFRIEVGPRGVTRVCVLRRHELPWDELVAVERFSRRAPKRRDQREEAGELTVTARQRKGSKGGLLARGTQRRSWQLTDRAEGFRQYEALKHLMAGYAPDTLLRASPPPQARRDSRPLVRGRGEG